MTSLALAGSFALGAVLGYIVRYSVERHRDLLRERALRALGGTLPDWEVQARELERQAYTQHADHTNMSVATQVASTLRNQADIIRKRGRARDKEWK